MPFYREVISGLGIRAIAGLGAANARQAGRLLVPRSHFAWRSLRRRAGTTARSALPVLSLGKRLYDSPLGPGSAVEAFSPRLTEREKEVLLHVTRGATNAQIAARLGTSPRTVKNQVSAILTKAGVENRTELVYLATRTNVESPNPLPAAK